MTLSCSCNLPTSNMSIPSAATGASSSVKCLAKHAAQPGKFHHAATLGLMLLAVLITACASLFANQAHGAKPKQPNIMWIVSEDNFPFLGCYGYPDANTPRLDKLATQGVLYRNAFANAPVCAPARNTLITGMYPPSNGTQHMRSKHDVDQERIQFFTHHLRKAGYFCTNNSKTDYNLSPYQNDAWDQMQRGDHKKRKKGQPFFAVYNIGTSHESSLHKGLDNSLFKAKVQIPPYHPDTPEIRANWAMYHKIITKMDGQVGAILDKLEAEGVADDTIVFYYGDHGGILPRSKRFLYETGVHVPLILRFGKNVAHLAPSKAGSKTDRLVSFVDFAPTVLSLSGVKIPKYMQGEAFLGEQKIDARDYVYLFRGRMDERYDFSRAVRDQRYKYIRNYNPHRPWGQHLDYLWRMPATKSWVAQYEAGKCNQVQSYFWGRKAVEELYDTQADPWEVKNLAGDPKHADTLKRLRDANRKHMASIHDSGFIPEGMLIELAGKKTIHDLVRDSKRYPFARAQGAGELATLGDVNNLPKLIEYLSDDSPIVRYWGATGCLILRDKAKPAQAQLQKALKDKHANVRIAAAEALMWTGSTKEALALLVAEVLDMENGSPETRLHAANALEEIKGKAKPALAELQKKFKGKGREYVSRAMGYTISKLASQ
jgi:N-sulfoglucosamine sulfohydrolase